MDLSSRGISKSREKLRPLYLYYQIVYDHQTWKAGDIPWGAPNHEVI